jgi:hypothetical protein
VEALPFLEDALEVVGTRTGGDEGDLGSRMPGLCAVVLDRPDRQVDAQEKARCLRGVDGAREGLGDSERADLRIEAGIHDRSPPGLGERIEDPSDAADVAAIRQAQGVDGLPCSSPGDKPSEVASSSTNEVDPFLIGDREAELPSHAVFLGQFAIFRSKGYAGSRRQPLSDCLACIDETLFNPTDPGGAPGWIVQKRAGNLQAEVSPIS